MATIEEHNAIHMEAIDKYRLHRLDDVIGDYRHTEEDTEEEGWRRITVTDAMRNRTIIITAYKEVVSRIEFGPIVIDADLSRLGVRSANIDLSEVPLSAVAEYDEMKRNLKALLEGRYKLVEGPKGLAISTNRGFAMEMQTKGVVNPITYADFLPEREHLANQVDPVEPFTKADGSTVNATFADKFALATLDGNKVQNIILAILAVATAVMLLFAWL